MPIEKDTTIPISGPDFVLLDIHENIHEIILDTHGASHMIQMQFSDELRRSREHNMSVIKKNRRLYQVGARCCCIPL
jgi:hypothetical protein